MIDGSSTRTSDNKWNDIGFWFWEPIHSVVFMEGK